jgi:hypothetical protein
MNIKLLSFFFFFLTYIVLFNHTHAESASPPPSTEYRVGLFGGDLIMDTGKVTHIIVIGSGQKDDSDQFFQSGLSRARRYKENYPDHQVVFISSPDVLNTPDEAVFTKYKMVIAKTVMQGLNGDLLLDEMMPFTQIASWDFYGHSSPWGLKIGSTKANLAPYDYEDKLIQLRSHFLPNAYVTLNACNTGFTVSPDLSQILRLPVSGSLTSSVFERIEHDGQWYKEEDESKTSVDLNKFSYMKTVLCSEGLCFRMKPSRFSYNSVWGQFKEGGLPFYKFFCKFNNVDSKCERGMANSLLTFASVLPITIDSDVETFKAVAYDWICSTKTDRAYYKSCVQGIEDAISRMDLVFQVHPGNELICDFKSCNSQVICKNDENGTPKLGTCHLKTPLNPEPTNAAREILAFTKGFTALKKTFKR